MEFTVPCQTPGQRPGRFVFCLFAAWFLLMFGFWHQEGAKRGGNDRKRGGNDRDRLFCEQSMHGGGWNLVYGAMMDVVACVAPPCDVGRQ